MEIRSATLKDLPQILQLFAETIKSTCKGDYNQEQLAAWAASAENDVRWKQRLLGQYFLVAEEGGALTGFASLADNGYVEVLYVHKDHLRKGIASRLYQKMEEESYRLGNKTLTTDASKTSRSFFQSKGFKVIKENKSIIRGVVMINYHMIKIKTGSGRHH